MEEVLVGKVKWFNDQKGYGFIRQTDGTDIFVHFTGIVGEGHKALSEGDVVEYEKSENHRGPIAVNVRIVEDEADV